MRRSPAVAAARAPGRRRGRRDGLPDALDYDTQLLIGTLEAHQAREGSWGTFRTKDRPGGECASAPQRDDGGTFARADEGCDVAAHAARTHRAPVPGRASASGRRLRPNLRDVGKQKLQSYFQRCVGCVAQGPAPPAVVKEVAASVVQGIELLCLVVTDQLPDL